MTTVLLVALLAVSLAALAVGLAVLARLRALREQDVERALRDELRQAREESAGHARALREEVGVSQQRANEVLAAAVEKLGAGVRESLRELREGNEKRLEEMRKTVDEKLQGALEKRLGESFKLVSERLEAVHRGLGEMQKLATGVGDLKRLLTNVKDRGTWGEYQLGAILEDVLAPDQYARNIRPKGGGELVEFAIRLPGREPGGPPVWLPIDAKFPKEDYERLTASAEAGDVAGIKSATQQLAAALVQGARDIRDKYLAPPETTEFAILFLPTEGLYAEVLRQPGLHDRLQREFHVLVAGPTTLAAILSSLRVGFRTLAIEQRSHEVWRVLGAVKAEFVRFGGMLDKVKKHLEGAANTLDESSRRTRAMERQLRTVEELPAAAADAVLRLKDGGEDDPPADAACN